MATKLSGFLNLSKIPKDLIIKNKKGESGIWIDVMARKETGKYGDTHTLTTYDKENRKTVYLSDLKPKDFGQSGSTQEDLPADDKFPF